MMLGLRSRASRVVWLAVGFGVCPSAMCQVFGQLPPGPARERALSAAEEFVGAEEVRVSDLLSVPMHIETAKPAGTIGRYAVGVLTREQGEAGLRDGSVEARSRHLAVQLERMLHDPVLAGLQDELPREELDKLNRWVAGCPPAVKQRRLNRALLAAGLPGILAPAGPVVGVAAVRLAGHRWLRYASPAWQTIDVDAVTFRVARAQSSQISALDLRDLSGEEALKTAATWLAERHPQPQGSDIRWYGPTRVECPVWLQTGAGDSRRARPPSWQIRWHALAAEVALPDYGAIVVGPTGRVEALDSFSRTLEIDVMGYMPLARAVELARVAGDLGLDGPADAEEADLRVGLDDGDGRQRLIWDLVINSRHGDYLVWIDAQSGEVLRLAFVDMSPR